MYKEKEHKIVPVSMSGEKDKGFHFFGIFVSILSALILSSLLILVGTPQKRFSEYRKHVNNTEFLMICLMVCLAVFMALNVFFSVIYPIRVTVMYSSHIPLFIVLGLGLSIVSTIGLSWTERDRNHLNTLGKFVFIKFSMLLFITAMVLLHYGLVGDFSVTASLIHWVVWTTVSFFILRLFIWVVRTIIEVAERIKMIGFNNYVRSIGGVKHKVD